MRHQNEDLTRCVMKLKPQDIVEQRDRLYGRIFKSTPFLRLELMIKVERQLGAWIKLKVPRPGRFERLRRFVADKVRRFRAGGNDVVR